MKRYTHNESSREHDIICVQQEEIDAVVDAINERPMGCLNYVSPAQLFSEMPNPTAQGTLHAIHPIDEAFTSKRD